MFDGLGDFLMDLIYYILLKLDGVIYTLVGWLYQVYMLISSARIFKTETFQIFIDRIYIILGVVMLFFLAYTILTNIVNPDNFNNEKSSMGKIISNTIISLVLIAVLPTIFNFLYYGQEIILEQNFLGKLILGNYSSASNSLEVTFDEETCQGLNEIGGEGNNQSCTKLYKNDKEEDSSVKLAGNSIAVDVFSAFYYPTLFGANQVSTSDSDDTGEADDTIESTKQVDSQEDNSAYNREFSYKSLEDDDGKEFNDSDKALYREVASYNPCHTEEEGYVYGSAAMLCAEAIEQYHDDSGKDENDLPLDFKSILQYSKSTGKFDGFTLLSASVHEGKMSYTILISTIAGLFVCYIMVSYCIDMGLRAAKLGFAQLVAPVPILARIIPKQASMFSSWINFTLKSYFEVFLRIIIIFLGIFMITHLPSLEGLWEESSLAHLSIMSLKTPLIMDISSASWGTQMMARVAIIIGILMFVKQAPSLIEQALGININASSLKIRDKLNNMIGGGLITKGMDKGTELSAKGFGAIRGGLGGLWAAKQNNGDKKEAFKKGMKEGFKRPKGAFNDNFQRTASDITGDNYKHSMFHSGNTLGATLEKNIDKSYKDAIKTNEKKRIEELKNIIKTYETAPNSKFVQQQNRMEQIIKNMEQSAAFQQTRNANQERLRKEWDANEGQEVRRRMAEYEHSKEYKNIHDQAWYKARADVRAEAQKNGEKLNMMKEQERVEKKLSSYIAQELENTISAQAKQYKADRERERNIDKELNRKAHNETIEQFKQLNDNYKQAKNSLDENNKLTASAAKQISDNIIKNPASAAEASYAKAKAELNNYDKASSDKALQANLKEVLKDLKIDTK